ncbi:MAG TPA: hypothetical protein VFA71_05775 [Terriglobales bacterium]|nr:hypothetical protein [Terriglobales bacterium]
MIVPQKLGSNTRSQEQERQWFQFGVALASRCYRVGILPAHSRGLLRKASLAMKKDTPDNDIAKGAMEQEDRSQHGNASLQGQLPHRTKIRLIKDSDSDFPEPGNNPEHSGEPEQ